jgi:hypothetical protein
MIRNKFVIVFLFLCITSSALAEDTYTRYALPLGKRIQSDGEIYRGFNFPDYKLLLKMDIRLREADSLVIDLYKKVELLEGKALQLNKIIELDNEASALVMTDLKRKDLLVTQLATKNVELQEKLNRRKRIMRVLLPIAGVGIASFAVGVGLSN